MNLASSLWIARLIGGTPANHDGHSRNRSWASSERNSIAPGPIATTASNLCSPYFLASQSWASSREGRAWKCLQIETLRVKFDVSLRRVPHLCDNFLCKFRSEGMRQPHVAENQHISLQRCLSRGWSTPEKEDESQQRSPAKRKPLLRKTDLA